MTDIIVSPLPKTWILDIDGVIFIHNSYLHGEDVIVPGFIDFYQQIPQEDCIILLSARKQEYAEVTKKALKKYNIRYNHIFFSMPKGERIVVNDTKPQGLETAHAINTKRDSIEKIKIIVDPNR